MNTNKSNETKTFKSRQAAQVAMTKAEKAYYAAMAWRNEVHHGPFCARKESEYRAADAALEAARLHACAVYANAERQGLYVRSYSFGVNPTRDLILANID